MNALEGNPSHDRFEYLAGADAAIRDVRIAPRIAHEQGSPALANSIAKSFGSTQVADRLSLVLCRGEIIEHALRV